MILGQVWDAERFNCVDFASQLLQEHGLPGLPQQAASAAQFMLAIRRAGWSPAAWPPRDMDLMLFRSVGGLHVGVWHQYRVWHCDEQSTATDWGTMTSRYRHEGTYRHVSHRD